jgi:hypothetical protein
MHSLGLYPGRWLLIVQVRGVGEVRVGIQKKPSQRGAAKALETLMLASVSGPLAAAAGDYTQHRQTRESRVSGRLGDG